MPNLTEHMIDIDGQRLAYVSEGPRAKTVVLIHGNSSCKEAFEAQFLALLQAGYGLLAVDLPGHGASDDAAHPETGYTIPAYAEVVRKVCDHLQLENPVLVGWSLGGHIAIQMVRENSTYSGLMICGTPPVGPGIEHAESAFLPSDVGDVTGADEPPKDRLDAYIRAVYGTLNPVPGVLVQAGHRADGRSRSNMLAHWFSGVSGHNQRDVVRAWQRPLRVIHGADDAFASGGYIRSLDLQGDGAGPVHELLDGIGHAPFLEAPEEFNRSLLAFCEHCFG